MPNGTVAIVGTGEVGERVAWGLAQISSARILCTGRDLKRVSAKVYDMRHAHQVQDIYRPKQGRSFPPIDAVALAEALAEADLVVTTFGSARGVQWRGRSDDLVPHDTLAREVAAEVRKHLKPSAIVVNVANPVDVMTARLQALCDLPTSRMLGASGMVDSARFLQAICEACSFTPEEVDASTLMVLGEHGAHMVPLLSQVHVRGRPLVGQVEPETLVTIRQRTMTAGLEILRDTQRAPQYGPAQGLIEMCRALLDDDQECVAPCTVWVSAYQTYMTWPTRLRRGSFSPMAAPHPLSASEQSHLAAAAAHIRSQIRSLGSL